MEVIVGGESGNTNAVEVKVVFPHLNFLRLSNLPMFRSLGSYNVILEFPSIEQVDFDEFQNPILLHESIFDKFQHVKELQLGGCEALLDLLNLEGRAFAIPPLLRKLTLYDMPNLQRISWMGFPIGNLRYLKIIDIDRLKSLFPTFLCNKGFVYLEEIHIDKCNNIERVLAQESSEDTSPTTVIFPRVKLIKLQHLSNLRSFSSENYHTIKFPSLEKVTIEKCQRMETFSYGSLCTPWLHKIKINCKDEKECFNPNAVIKKRMLCCNKFEGNISRELEDFSLPSELQFDPKLAPVASSGISYIIRKSGDKGRGWRNGYGIGGKRGARARENLLSLQQEKNNNSSIKWEISIMKIVRHPYVVRLHEVLASWMKIYIILEFVTGGELFDKIVHQGRLSEKESRRYFRQLIDAVSHCHSKGVYHRDLKPENLLLDSHGNLMVSDFGLSALPQQVPSSQGYDGAAADVWSCGVILYVLMAGYLAFLETDLPSLYKKRIKIEGIKNIPWFRVNYIPVRHGVEEEVNLDDVHAVFEDIEDQYVTDPRNNDMGPLVMNAFEMITLSQGLNLSALFDRQQVCLLKFR
ncbi:hypothetical protein Nepgr_016001 [Nepenthes gracilis]|uniref:non-specific serine/threonine protein kinase n=1 Tax=Nepenthes gracilis TaxID=150966 RepID=A0AAD3XS47_NEPGR|nr:hypothetical protein Nepgr_016001 [Nepenthes gracilis]